MDLAQTEHHKAALKKDTLPVGQVVTGVEFSDCAFSKCSYREVRFVNCKFIKCVFKDCDLNLAKLDDTTFVETRFEACKLLGINWTVSAWGQAILVPRKPADFIGCAMNYNVFMGMNLRKVTLSNCAAIDVGFEDANLTEADCRGTDFTGSRFVRTDLTQADFRGARNYGISPVTNKLKGAKFSLPEAMSLLHGLEIVLDAD